MTLPPRGPKAIGPNLLKGLNPILRRQGFAVSEVLTRWPTLVGAVLSEQARPEKLSFSPGRNGDATLYLRVAPGFAPEVQMLSPLIIERLNSYYGYRAVARIAIKQGPLPLQSTVQMRAPRALTDEEKARLEALLEPIRDSDLKESLRRLGSSLLGLERMTRS